MANNNDQLYNAALMGFIAGAEETRKLVSTTAGDYATVIAAAQAFATAVDAAIPADGTIVTPTTAVTLEKVNLLTSLCQSQTAGSIGTGTAGNAASAAAIATLYNAAVAVLA